METTIIVSAGTKGKESGFTFPLVVDSSSRSFNDFRATICTKYPWGLFDAIKIRYWDSLKECWNPLRCDDELGVMFASNAETRPCNLEITVIQRKRGQRCEKTAGGIGVEEGVGHVDPGQLLLVLLVLLELVQQVQVPLQLLLNVALIDQRISLIQLWKRHCLMHLFYLMRRMRNFTQVMSSTTMTSIQHMKSTFLQGKLQTQPRTLGAKN